MSNGSNILAVVGGITLTACTVGIHLVQALIAPTPPHPRPTIVAQQTTPAQAHAPAIPARTVVPRATAQASKPHAHFAIVAHPTTTAHTAMPARHPVTQVHTAAPQVPDSTNATTTPAQADPVIEGDQATYTNQAPLFRVTYPKDWTVTSSSNTYSMVSPDANAGVGVYIVASAPVDTTGLLTALTSKLPYFLQQYGGSATGTPQYQVAYVDGIPAEVSAFPVAKNGLSGVASVSAVYKDGDIYYVWGVVADETTADASQELSQVQAIMDGFHLT